ncbi:MAG: GGDEF domain-containing protein [Alphaproteobacteria bacterium]|nr:GGDEF domain-containing protein [Alphaproteobacteria bacterium]
MSHEFDLSVDWLADAPLSAEQRRAWTALRGELASAQAKNQEMQKKIRLFEQQQTDIEPSILNRLDFNREVARMLAFDERYGGMSSVLYFDFEHLDERAARFGRAVADAALREICATLSRSVRSSDIIGRLAGGEFGVLLMHCDNDLAWRKAEVLAAQLQKTVAEIQGCKLDVRVSYGAYTFRDNEDLAVGLKEAAQKMTSVAK